MVQKTPLTNRKLVRTKCILLLNMSAMQSLALFSYSLDRIVEIVYSFFFVK